MCRAAIVAGLMRIGTNQTTLKKNKHILLQVWYSRDAGISGCYLAIHQKLAIWVVVRTSHCHKLEWECPRVPPGWRADHQACVEVRPNQGRDVLTSVPPGTFGHKQVPGSDFCR